MIILVNGSFGVGKTTTCEGLVRALPNSHVFDPEVVGSMLRRVLGDLDKAGDFQDYPMWRSLFVETARELKAHLNRDLIIPMTIRRTDYFTEVTEGLRLIDPDFHHFCLVADEEEIVRRIRARGEQPEGDWIFEQVPKCVEAFLDPIFETKIEVTELGTTDVVDRILRSVRS